ncbi:PEP-CTERM system TPR-repeat protein PrsT [Colwellia sp. D2M02]|uniref:XrtA/PEP-CTERM system TPR-repeat protein PrsT n=1 Tax=Colwellia sp. D2M02 TaxID=2841562 RepID=UPI001C095B60|nr:XrtA/PEP-CTERM system TPR-repeat protein PrsT [Colwellia sp. D2M02]MBU2895012.1 PEP-CTERM system TPR-repeat protein PrsT [Colwellia sp. D2M02]
MRLIKTTLCVSIMLALSACGEKETVESHINSAKTYIDANQVNESIISLKNAIRLDSKNAQARFLLGEIYLQLGDGPAAVKELERSKKLGSNNKHLIPLLARAYLLTESDNDVIALNEAATQLASEQQSHYLAYQTLSALRLENTELAKESVTTAQNIAAQSMYSMLANAYLQLSENNNEEAKTLVDRVLAIDSKQVDALMLQGQIATVMKDYKQASDSYEQYLALQPRSGIIKLLLADSLLKAEKYVEAEKYADAILASISTQPFAHYIKAMVRFEDKDFAKSSEHAESALAADFNQMNLKLVAGASAFYLKNWEQATYHLRSVVKYLPKDHLANRMLAVSQLELGLVSDISDTLDGFTDVDSPAANADFLASVSFKLLELGAVNEAKKLVVQSESLNSDNAEVNARQGILKLMMNDPSGIDDLKDAVKLDPELVEAELALAFAALQSGDIDQAKSIATSWQEKYPEKAGGSNLMASIAIQQEQYDEAERLLEQSLQLEPDNLFALTQQLRIARQQNNEELSHSRADYIITVYPANTHVLKLYFSAYRNDAALEKLIAAYKLDSEDINKVTLLAEAYLSLGKDKEAESVLNTIENQKNLPKRYWQLVVLIAKQQQDLDQMLVALEKWQQANPYHLEPVVLLADLYAKQRNYDRALITVKRGLEQHQDNLILQLVNMQLLLNANKLLEAKEQYKVLAVKDIDANLKDGMQGRIFLLEKNFVQAVPKLESFYKAYSNTQNAFYLAGAYISNNEGEKALSLLEDYLAANPDDIRVKATLAGLYLENESSKEKAISYYADIVQQQPKDVIINNNLAWLYLEKGNVEQGLKHAKTAFDLAPNVPNVADTYGQALLKSGDKAAALKFSGQAMELAQGKDADIALNYVEILMANGHPNKAEEVLDTVVVKTKQQEKRKLMLSTQL